VTKSSERRIESRRFRRLLLAGLLLLGLGLRLGSVGWGIGLRQFEGYYHPDESKVWRTTLDFPDNYLTNDRYLYGTALQYSVGFVLYPVKKLWRGGHLRIADLEYQQVVILALRAVNVILGALTVLLVYLLGSRLYDRGTGLIAAGLLCFSLYHVTNSGFATLDVTMSFLVTLTVLLTARAFETGRLVDFALLGLTGGLLAGTKISAILILVVPLALIAARVVAQSGQVVAEKGTSQDSGAAPRARDLGVRLLISGLIATFVFTVSTPHVLVQMPAYLEYMLGQRTMLWERFDHGVWAVLNQWTSDPAVAMTPVVAGLAGVGLLLGRLGVRRESRALEFALLAFLLANVLFWRAYLRPRFLIPIVPILCIYAARPPRLLMNRPERWARVAGGAVAVLALGFSLSSAVVGVSYRRETDTRTEAAAYIAARVPAGVTLAPASTTASNRWTTHRWRYPTIDTARYVIAPLLENPDYVVTTDYVLRQMERALSSGQLEAGFHWPSERANRWYRYRVPEPEDFRFYDSLLREESYRLEKRWLNPPPVPVEFPAPEIRLYRRTAR
jgi:hypothetical protein